MYALVWMDGEIEAVETNKTSPNKPIYGARDGELGWMGKSEDGGMDGEMDINDFSQV